MDQIKTTMQGFAMINAHLTCKELVQFVGVKNHKAGFNVGWELQNHHKSVEKSSLTKSQVSEISPSMSLL